MSHDVLPAQRPQPAPAAFGTPPSFSFGAAMPRVLAAQCASLQEVRTRIDETDRQLVALLAERAQYVSQAAGFKRSEDEVPAPRRAAEVLARVLARAQEVGAPAPVVEATYRAMISAFIQHELGCFTTPATGGASVPGDPVTAAR